MPMQMHSCLALLLCDGAVTYQIAQTGVCWKEAAVWGTLDKRLELQVRLGSKELEPRLCPALAARHAILHSCHIYQ